MKRPVLLTRPIFMHVLLLALMLPALTRAEHLPDFRALVKANGQAVVNISTKSDPAKAANPPPGHGLPGGPGAPGFPGMPDMPDDSPLKDFFEHFFGDRDPGQPPHPFGEQSSLGSGFIISEDGYVISNEHVVRGADEVIVRLSDRREFVATLVGTDERSDIALLKIETDESLPFLEIGDSAKLEQGEWVFAIGSPFGFDYTVTQGIVSALGRSLPNENYVPFIQTDVAINPGNSGGPLFNLDGNVVGVNSQIFSRTGGFMGLSFAIPINMVMEVVAQLQDSGSVRRGWLGVLIQDVDQQLAESFDLDRPRGALVSRVLDDSPAAAAGFEVGDIILSFNNNPIPKSSDLPPIVGRTPIGEPVPVMVLRGGSETQIQVTIGELPDETSLAAATQAQGPDSGTYRDVDLAMTLAQLSAEERIELDLGPGGVLVQDVAEGPAFAAGLRPGDILLQLNGQGISTLEAYAEVRKGLESGSRVPALVQRRGGPLFMAIKIPEAQAD